MRIEISFTDRGSIDGRYLNLPAVLEWFKNTLDPDQFCHEGEEGSGISLLRLQNMDPDYINLVIDYMSQELPFSPMKQREKIASELRSKLKQAQNARGKHKKKYQDA